MVAKKQVGRGNTVGDCPLLPDASRKASDSKATDRVLPLAPAHLELPLQWEKRSGTLRGTE